MLDETAKTFIIVGCVFGILTTVFACCFACSVMTEFKARLRRSVSRRSRSRRLVNPPTLPESLSSHSLKTEMEKEMEGIPIQTQDLRELIVEVPLNLQCAVCLGAYSDPKTLFCGHTFCSKCINACKEPKCPLCQSIFTTKTAYNSVVIKQMVEELPAKCIYLNQCSWSGPYGQVQDHVMTICPYREEACLNEGCNYRCSQSAMFDHFKDCPHLIVKCPNGCGVAIKQGFRFEHDCSCERYVKIRKLSHSLGIHENAKDYNLNDIPNVKSNPIYDSPVILSKSNSSNLHQFRDKTLPLQAVYWGAVNSQKKSRKISIGKIETVNPDKCRCILQGFLFKISEDHVYCKENIRISGKKWEFQFGVAGNGYLLIYINYKSNVDNEAIEKSFTLIFNHSPLLECCLKSRSYKSNTQYLWEIQHQINYLINIAGDLDLTIATRSPDFFATPLLNLKRLPTLCRMDAVAGQLQIPLEAIYLGCIKYCDIIGCSSSGHISLLSENTCRWDLPKVMNRIAAGERVFYSPCFLSVDAQWEIRISINSNTGFVYLAIFLKGQQKFVDATISLHIYGQQEYVKSLDSKLFKVKCGHLWELQRRLRSMVDAEKNFTVTIQIIHCNLTSRFLK